MKLTTGGITLFPHARLPIKGPRVTVLPKLYKNWNVTFQVWHQTQPKLYQTPKYNCIMSLLQVYLKEIPTEKTNLFRLKAENASAGNGNKEPAELPAVFFKVFESNQIPQIVLIFSDWKDIDISANQKRCQFQKRCRSAPCSSLDKC